MTYLKLTKLFGKLYIYLNSGSKILEVSEDDTSFTIDDLPPIDSFYSIFPPYLVVSLETNLLIPVNSTSIFKNYINLKFLDINTSQTN